MALWSSGRFRLGASILALLLAAGIGYVMYGRADEAERRKLGDAAAEAAERITADMYTFDHATLDADIERAEAHLGNGALTSYRKHLKQQHDTILAQEWVVTISVDAELTEIESHDTGYFEDGKLRHGGYQVAVRGEATVDYRDENGESIQRNGKVRVQLNLVKRDGDWIVMLYSGCQPGLC